MGESNSGGSSTTGLVVNSAATALAVTQTGTSLNGSNGIRSDASYGTGGVFTSSFNTAILAIASGQDQNALWAVNSAGSRGTGAANRAEGGKNDCIVATTTSATDLSRALYGQASSETRDVRGVVGLSHGDSGVGTYGRADTLTTTAFPVGVCGGADSPAGIGVFGEAAAPTGATYGVYGYAASPDGWGVFSDGDQGTTANLYVSGTVTKGGGSFKIDHPLDPANKYLYHSFVESPDMKNVYDGVVTLNGNGEATVELPDWFEALNRDVRYQLTAIGAPGPDLYVKSKVTNNHFTIAGGKSAQEVSWQLTGIRQDAWANDHRIPVEEGKAKADKGLYLHPTEHGKPVAKGIDHVRTKALRERAGKAK